MALSVCFVKKEILRTTVVRYRRNLYLRRHLNVRISYQRAATLSTNRSVVTRTKKIYCQHASAHNREQFVFAFISQSG